MLHTNGRKVTSIDEAKLFIREFMFETIHNLHESGYGKTYDFDLYLPHMMDWVLNIPQEHDATDLSPTDLLESIYMDAAWSLCRDGLVRPGPRSTAGESPGGSYAKGYSLTPEGKEWLAATPKPAPAGESTEATYFNQ